jgi:hypothetical protein
MRASTLAGVPIAHQCSGVCRVSVGLLRASKYIPGRCAYQHLNDILAQVTQASSEEWREA